MLMFIKLLSLIFFFLFINCAFVQVNKTVLQNEELVNDSLTKQDATELTTQEEKFLLSKSNTVLNIRGKDTGLTPEQLKEHRKNYFEVADKQYGIYHVTLAYESEVDLNAVGLLKKAGFDLYGSFAASVIGSELVLIGQPVDFEVNDEYKILYKLSYKVKVDKILKGKELFDSVPDYIYVKERHEQVINDVIKEAKEVIEYRKENKIKELFFLSKREFFNFKNEKLLYPDRNYIENVNQDCFNKDVFRRTTDLYIIENDTVHDMLKYSQLSEERYISTEEFQEREKKCKIPLKKAIKEIEKINEIYNNGRKSNFYQTNFK